MLHPYVGVYGVQTQRELVGIVVDNAEKKRRDAQDQMDDVNKKWQSTQDTCNDYKGRLEQARAGIHQCRSCEGTHIAAVVFVHQSQHVSHCNVACCSVVLKDSVGGQPFELSLLYTHLQCHTNIACQLSVRI